MALQRLNVNVSVARDANGKAKTFVAYSYAHQIGQFVVEGRSTFEASVAGDTDEAKMADAEAKAKADLAAKFDASKAAI